jgi:Co/Zn/Cd efflux system component
MPTPNSVTLISSEGIMAQEVFLRLVPTLIDVPKEKMVLQVAHLALLANLVSKVYLDGPKNMAKVQEEFVGAYEALKLDFHGEEEP